MASSPLEALAYLNWGQWVADCPYPKCTDARAVFPEDRAGIVAAEPQLDQTCANGHRFRIALPADHAGIDAVMAERVEEGDRVWYPRGHPRAVELGLPMGLSEDELREEGHRHNARRAAEREQS